MSSAPAHAQHCARPVTPLHVSPWPCGSVDYPIHRWGNWGSEWQVWWKIPHAEAFNVGLACSRRSVCIKSFKVKVKSCSTLCDSMDCSPPGSSIHGIFQARVLEWAAISFSRGSSQTRDWAQASCTAGFTVWATREALKSFNPHDHLWNGLNYSHVRMSTLRHKGVGQLCSFTQGGKTRAKK